MPPPLRAQTAMSIRRATMGAAAAACLLLLLGAAAAAPSDAASNANASCTFDGYDFSSLSGKDLTASDYLYTYYLSVCGTLSSSPASVCTQISAQSSACQVEVKDTVRAFDIGNWAPNEPAPIGPQWSYIDPNNKNKGVMYTMQGAQQCWASGSPTVYTATVMLTCAAQQGPLSVSTGENSCAQQWILPTPLACRAPPPPPASECSFDGYDFSSLSGQDLIASDYLYMYYLSVCGTLSSSPASVCTQISAQSSACQVEVKDTVRAFDIGNWAPNEPAPIGPQWSYIDPSNKALGVSMSMQGAQQCWAAGSAERYVANVLFVCSRNQGPLKVLPIQGSCWQNYTLPTPLACPAAARVEEQRSIFLADE